MRDINETNDAYKEPVAWQTVIDEYDPPGIFTHLTLRSAENYRDGAGHDRCRIVTIFDHSETP